MMSIQSVFRQVYHKSGIRRAHLGAYKAALKARGGTIVNGAGIVLHANPADERGLLLARKRGELDRNTIAIWRRLAAELRPTVAIDIGANYGEVAFSTRYSSLRELHLVEPNPLVLDRLRETIERAAASYPRIVLHAGAASGEAGFARLNLHRHSGGASLRRGSERGFDVECFRLDERVQVAEDDSLLFKIDVEGHELAVLEGMADLLHCRRIAGICEILHADDELVEFLCDRFAVTALRRGTEYPVDAKQLRELLTEARAHGWGDLSRDVIVRSVS